MFYCSQGKETRIGIEDEKNVDDPTRVAISSTSELSTFLKNNYSEMIKTDEEGNIVAEGLTLIKKIEITNDSSLSNIKDLRNLQGLQELNIKNVNLNSLDGIQNLSSINYIYIENSTIGDYSQMISLKNLKYLYLYNTNNNEIEKLCEGIKTAKYEKLQYLGIYGYNSTVNTNNTWLNTNKVGQVSDISSLDKLSEITKKSIKYMYLNNNYITNISSLSGFENLLELRLQQNSIVDVTPLSNMTKLINLYINNNKIKSLKGLKKLNSISYIYAQNNSIGKDEVTNERNSSLDGLTDLQGNKSLKYIHLGNNNNLKWVSYLSECSSIRYIYLDNCNNILDMAQISNILKTCGGNSSYPTKYSLALASDVEKLDLSNSTYEINFFKTSLTGKTNIKYLSLKNLKLTDELGSIITNENTINTTLNDILKTLTNLQTLQLQGIPQIKEITFVNNVINLTELDLRGTKVTTGTKDSNGAYTGLELLNQKGTKLKTLAIDSTNTTAPINLVNIQNTINRLRNGMQTGCWVCGFGNDGGLIASDTIYKTLENCTTMTTLYIGRHNIAYSNVSLNLSNCTSLNSVWFCGMSGTFNFPKSLKKILLCYSRGKHIYAEDTENIVIEEYPNWISNVAEGVIDNIWEGIALCKSINTLKIGSTNWNSIGNVALAKNVNINRLEFNGVATYDMNINLDGIENLTNLKQIKIANYSKISNLDKISNLTNLQLIDISHDKVSMNISDINFIQNLITLTSVRIYNGQVGNLTPIANLNNLNYLNLNKNSITNILNTESGIVNNVEILNNLHSKKLVNLYIKENQFTDKSPLNWAKEI